MSNTDTQQEAVSPIIGGVAGALIQSGGGEAVDMAKQQMDPSSYEALQRRDLIVFAIMKGRGAS